MGKIDILILKAAVPPFLISTMVLTFVVFLRELGRISELLITRNASLEVIGVIAGVLLPGILIFSLPLSYLIGILIGLSGLSGESQIIALRACGVPLRRLLIPVMSLGAAVGVLTAVLSLIILPASNDILQNIKDNIGLRQATSQIQPRVFNEEFPHLVFYFDDISIERRRWSRVFLADNTNPKSPRIVLAEEGGWVSDRAAFRLQLHLKNGSVYEFNPEDPSNDNVSVFVSTDIPIELNQGSTSLPAAGGAPAVRKVAEQGTADLWRGASGATPLARREQLIELHRRMALPCSVIGFTLLGLTLGVTTKKGGRALGFVLSFVFVLLFFTLFSGGIRLASVGKVPPWLGVWGANLMLLGFGTLLVATAERSVHLGTWFTDWRRGKKLEPLGKQLHPEAARSGIERIDDVIVSSTRTLARFSFPKILDVYVSKGFCLYFLCSTVVCSTLFVVLTLFDLLDDIIRNRIRLVYVIEYFVFLTPHILLLVIPMSVLLAILINFGILEKSSQVTALKAGGWSLYRIALPVFLIASVLCLGLYFMQDYFLPYANIRQDSIRHLIKGRPPQTSMRPQRKWIFGESNRIFNYDYFDSSQKVFVGLNVYEVDLRALEVSRRIHADRAAVRENADWILENGWIRDFRPGGESFRPFSRTELSFPEKAAYFEREVFEPKESSKLTYLELKNYITDLRKSGYNATELQVELYKKISFPLSCVVMAMVGIPFSFSMGRKGAFFGITLSIVVAMAYWGIFSVFEQMGAYGLLIPTLAAWAANIVFAAAGLALLFTIRT
jgi:lipopolysaccharide export system permease protein